MRDKETLLNTGEHGWLNSDHIRAASDLLSRQFPEVGGFQDRYLLQLKITQVDGDTIINLTP